MRHINLKERTYSDMQNIAMVTDDTIDNVLPEELSTIINEQWEKATDLAKMDFGGGISAIMCNMLLTACDSNPHKLYRMFDGMKLKDAKLAISLCQESLANSPYT